MSWKLLDIRKGTLGRLEYFAYGLTINVIMGAAPLFMKPSNKVILFLIFLIFLYLKLLIEARRLRDIGFSILLIFIPLSIVVIDLSLGILDIAKETKIPIAIGLYTIWFLYFLCLVFIKGKNNNKLKGTIK